MSAVAVSGVASLSNPHRIRTNFLLFDITNQFNPTITTTTTTRCKKRLTIITSSSSTANALPAVDFNPLQSALEKVCFFSHTLFISILKVNV